MSTPRSVRRPRAGDSERAPSRGVLYLGAGFALVLALVLFAIATTEWKVFRIPANGYDLAFFNQGFYVALHEHGWIQSTLDQGTGHGAILGAHFSPNLYLLLPVYAVWQSPLLLLFLTSLGVAAAGFGVFLTARRIFGGTVVPLVWLALFALYPSIPGSVDNGFREVFVAMALLSFALLFYIDWNKTLFFLMIALALLSKEDIALLLPVWGGVAWLQRKDRRLAISLIVLGVVYFVFANAVALPVIRGMPVGTVLFSGYWSPVGHNPAGVLGSFVSAPGDVVRLLLGRHNLWFYAQLLGPLLFLPVLGWEYLVIPAYVYLETSLNPPMQQLSLRFIFPAIPFMFVAAMVGASRLIRGLERIAHLPSARAAAARTAGLTLLLCGTLAATVFSTPFPSRVRENWPTEARLRGDTPLFQTMARIPPRASLAATLSLLAEGSSRDRLYYVEPDGANFDDIMGRAPDYIAIDMEDLGDTRRAPSWVASSLCRGAYGVKYEDRLARRFVLERGADAWANQGVYDALFPGAPQECPVPSARSSRPADLERAVHARVRAEFPSDVLAWDMFTAPVVASTGRRFAQVVRLPDHTFTPGWYRVDLEGAWPLLGIPGSSRMTVRMVVGDRTVGEAAASGDQALRYSTPRFHIDRRATLPVVAYVELQAPAGETEAIRALRPSPQTCAVAADAPSLNPRQVTVEAWVYPEGMVRRSETEFEAPILSKGDAPGYYLRLSGDAPGKVWVDFNVAGKWALGLAGIGAVPLRQWTAIAATYDGQEAKIYIGGRRASQDVSRSPHYAGIIRGNGAPLVIGCRNPGPDAVAFPGLIASAMVWNRVLSPQEIEDGAGMQIVPAGGSGGLVGSWKFQSVEGGLVPDLSAAGNPIRNGAGLARVSALQMKEPLAAWRSRHLNVVRLVTVRRVEP